MVAFEVSINGKRRYVAGQLDARLLNVSVSAHVGLGAASPASFLVNGFVSVPGANAQLDTLAYPYDQLSVGDEVTVRIVEVDSADTPSKQSTGLGSLTHS